MGKTNRTVSDILLSTIIFTSILTIITYWIQNKTSNENPITARTSQLIGMDKNKTEMFDTKIEESFLKKKEKIRNTMKNKHQFLERNNPYTNDKKCPK